MIMLSPTFVYVISLFSVIAHERSGGWKRDSKKSKNTLKISISFIDSFIDSLIHSLIHSLDSDDHGGLSFRLILSDLTNPESNILYMGDKKL